MASARSDEAEQGSSGAVTNNPAPSPGLAQARVQGFLQDVSTSVNAMISVQESPQPGVGRRRDHSELLRSLDTVLASQNQGGAASPAQPASIGTTFVADGVNQQRSVNIAHTIRGVGARFGGTR
ncbi:hypothetical protein F5B20DRAFT_111941 [Whalleya microplaca]|nr:hypothetical protein F5B20DRAFT_111941 [Whalleya microplaca]